MNAHHVRTNLRLAGLVKRYHTWPVIREQNVAEHSWHVARIYLTIFGGEPISHDVWVYIMTHDCGELVTGDLPYPVKAENPILKDEINRIESKALQGMGAIIAEVTPIEKLKIKLCDMIEMWEYGLEELAKGNTLARPILADTEGWIIRESVNLGNEVRRMVGLHMASQRAKMQ